MARKRILVIDDEPDLVDMVKSFLQKKGYSIITAYDGKEALQMIRTEKPDLIVLDLMLPKMDGYRICRMVKFDEKLKHIPIVIISVRASDADKKMGREVGADDYITKPFDFKVLHSSIKGLIGPGASDDQKA